MKLYHHVRKRCSKIIAYFYPDGDRGLIISTYPMSQKLRGTPRLLFRNGCFWLDDIAELKILFFSLADAKFNFLQIGVYLLPDAFILCFIKVKLVTSNLNQDRVFPKYGSHYTTCNSWKKSRWMYVFSFLFPLIHVLAWTKGIWWCPTCVVRCRINCQKLVFISIGVYGINN